jgi:hypothetical protein
MTEQREERELQGSGGDEQERERLQEGTAEDLAPTDSQQAQIKGGPVGWPDRDQ